MRNIKEKREPMSWKKKYQMQKEEDQAAKINDEKFEKLYQRRKGDRDL